jgi:hypothetical protein
MDRPLPLIAAAVAAAGIIGAAALPGCGSNCAANCPATELQILATSGQVLNVTSASWTGPACPDTVPLCRGTGSPCERFGIIAKAPGACDLTIMFSDCRPMTIHGEFGPPSHQGCCMGFPVVGDAVVVIPPLDAGICADAASNDGANDAAGGASDGLLPDGP